MNYTGAFSVIENGGKEGLSYYLTRFNDVVFGDLLTSSNVELIMYGIIIFVCLGRIISFLFQSKE